MEFVENCGWSGQIKHKWPEDENGKVPSHVLSVFNAFFILFYILWWLTTDQLNVANLTTGIAFFLAF